MSRRENNRSFPLPSNYPYTGGQDAHRQTASIFVAMSHNCRNRSRRLSFAFCARFRIILKSAVERGSFDQTMDEMDIVDPVDFTRKGIDFLVHFVHKVHDIQRIARRIRS